jgi:serine/threonine protein phosphatase PrpC
VLQDGAAPLDAAAQLQSIEAERAAEAEIIKVSGSISAGSGVLAHAFKSRKGHVPYNKSKVNQDRGVLAYGLQNDPSVALWAIMDGHGEYGHFVASFLQEHLGPTVASQAELKLAPEKSLTECMRRACDELVETNINVSFSGSTCCYGVKLPGDMLYVCNIGDSRAVLCRQADNGELQAIGLSVDQKPENAKEKARILKAGGRVEPLPGPPGEDCGPPRVWLAEVDVPGLAMARSVGDEVAQTVGVISVPEIIPHQLQSNDIFCIFASDGVWEFLNNEQACSVVWKYKHDLQQAAEELVNEAAKQWRKEEEVQDDISVIIVLFNQPK